MYDVVIIGCGVVGAATARELSKYDLKTAVLEAQNDVAMGASKANSAIIHAGYDPKAGSEMAELNILGNRLTAELCEKLDVPFKRIGSLVVAFDENDLKIIRELYARGVSGGIEGLAVWDKAKCFAEEPNLSRDAVGALYAPTAGIISPWELTLALAQSAVRNGAHVFLNTEVKTIARQNGAFSIATADGRRFESTYIINAAGTHCDEVAALAGDDTVKLVPTKGEYYLLDKSEGTRIRHIVFQCPTKMGKGTLIAPTVHGNLIVGPNAQVIVDRNDTSTTSEGLAQVMRAAQRAVPSVNFRDNIRNFAGKRANLETDAFIIAESAVVRGLFNLAGIKSPGLTCAPAIALKAVELLKAAGLRMEPKTHFSEERKVVRMKNLSDGEKNTLIKEDPRYGRVVCRCETITEGEIIDALHGVIPARSLDGVKRRTTAGMGRCQGGFCSSRIVALMAKELHIPAQDVVLDKNGSNILTGRTKTGGGA